MYCLAIEFFYSPNLPDVYKLHSCRLDSIFFSSLSFFLLLYFFLLFCTLFVIIFLLFNLLFSFPSMYFFTLSNFCSSLLIFFQVKFKCFPTRMLDRGSFVSRSLATLAYVRSMFRCSSNFFTIYARQTDNPCISLLDVH